MSCSYSMCCPPPDTTPSPSLIFAYSELEREDQAALGIQAPTGPSQDFSLKSGEKITVKIGNKTVSGVPLSSFLPLTCCDYVGHSQG